MDIQNILVYKLSLLTEAIEGRTYNDLRRLRSNPLQNGWTIEEVLAAMRPILFSLVKSRAGNSPTMHTKQDLFQELNLSIIEKLKDPEFNERLKDVSFGNYLWGTLRHDLYKIIKDGTLMAQVPVRMNAPVKFLNQQYGSHNDYIDATETAPDDAELLDRPGRNQIEDPKKAYHIRKSAAFSGPQHENPYINVLDQVSARDRIAIIRKLYAEIIEKIGLSSRQKEILDIQLGNGPDGPTDSATEIARILSARPSPIYKNSKGNIDNNTISGYGPPALISKQAVMGHIAKTTDKINRLIRQMDPDRIQSIMQIVRD
jgi:hypothetical protein